MKNKFLKGIYYAGDVYSIYTFKYGVFVDINHNESFFSYHNNVRDALRYIYEYSEFCLGKHILKGTKSYEDKYVTDDELKVIENFKKDSSCKHYNFGKKECIKQKKNVICVMNEIIERVLK